METSIKKIIEDFAAWKYPNAEMVIWGGSVIYGEATPESDLDVVIIDDTQPGSKLSCEIFSGWKIETFVYTKASLHFQFDIARLQGVPTILKICAEGKLIKDQWQNGPDLQAEAMELFKLGPVAWKEKEVREARYHITDDLSDFIGSEDIGENVYILSDLFDKVSEMILRVNGHWSGEGKWRARVLKETNEVLYHQMINNFHHYIQTKDKKSMISLINSVLDSYGGKMFHGFEKSLI